MSADSPVQKDPKYPGVKKNTISTFNGSVCIPPILETGDKTSLIRGDPTVMVLGKIGDKQNFGAI